MPVAWFIVPFTRRNPPPMAWLKFSRYLAINDYIDLVAADGGVFKSVEIRNNRALIKVRASAATLATLNALPGWKRLPKDLLNDPLSSLTVNQRNAIRSELQDQGYTLVEINLAFPNGIGNYTLRDVLQFMTNKRRTMAYDIVSDGLVESVEQVDCFPGVDTLDTEVT